LVVVVVLLVAADVESVRSGVVLMSLFRRDDAMDGIADVGSVARRIAACAFVRKESVLVERCGWPALVVDCGRYWLTLPRCAAQELSNRLTGNDHEH
jgi:hypothetical protein